MPKGLEITVAIVTLIANAITIGGVIKIVLLCKSLIKNTFSNKTVEINVQHKIETPFMGISKAICFDIDVANCTDKYFCITKIIVEFSPTLFFELKNGTPNHRSGNAVKNISFVGHEAKTISGFIEMSKEIELPKSVTVKLNNTYNDLNYVISISS